MNTWVRFLISRLVRLVVVVVVLITATFAVVRLVPGDPATAVIGLQSDRTPEQQAAALARARSELHLDDSLPVQYLRTLGSTFRGDLGTSFQTGEAVTTVIADRMPSTMRLAAIGTLIILLVAVPLGMAVAAFTQGRRKGLEVGFSALTGFVGALPPYALATFLSFVFAITWKVLPLVPEGSMFDDLLPALAIGLGPAFLLARVVRVETLDVLSQDYVRTARSKWLPRRRLYLRDVVPNVLTPALTIGGVLFASLLGGAVVVEQVFGRAGLGSKLVASVLAKDYPVVLGISIFLGVVVVVVNTLVDIVLAVIDPRTLMAAT